MLCTTLSKAFAQTAISESRKTAGDLMIVDLDDSIHAQLKQAMLSPFALRVNSAYDWPKRDTTFRQLFMPGEQFGFSLPTTDLPAWKMLAMDRMSFWYGADVARKQYEYLMALQWEKAIVSADMNHPLPFALARHSGMPVIGLQTENFRTREWYDWLTVGLPFQEMIVETPADRAFLEGHGYSGKVHIV